MAPLALQPPERRPDDSSAILTTVVLLAFNIYFAFFSPELWVATTAFFLTAGVVLYRLLKTPARVPPLLDFAFVFAALFYYGLPGLFYLAYPDQPRVASLPLQQSLVASTVATFYLLRRATAWRRWTAIVSGENPKGTLPFDGRFAMMLMVASILWIGVAIPGLARYMATQYGTREVAQRSDMTIPLLGFDMFTIAGTALLTERLIRTRVKRTWLLLGLLAFAAYGIACVFIFGSRTRLVGALLCPGVAALAIRRLTVKTAVIVTITVLSLLPVFSIIGRARSTFHEEDPSLSTLANTQVGDSFEAIAADSEMVAMIPMADKVIKRLGTEPLLGKYVGWSIVQAPPAFILRPVGLADPHSLADLYTQRYTPDVWARGGGWGLSLSAEAYCNFQEWGGLFSGIFLFLFVVAFERWVLSRLPFSLALAMAAQFMISISRVNRGGIESLPKMIAVNLVMLVAIFGCESIAKRLPPSVRRSSPRDA